MDRSNSNACPGNPLSSPIKLNVPIPRLFEAVAEGNMHCYCLLQLVDGESENRDFLVRYANEKLIGLLKAPEKAVVGKRLSGVYPFSENWIQCGKYFEALRYQRPILEEFPLEIFQQTRWYRHEIVPLSNELLSITAEDITERKLLEKALVRSAYFDDLTGLKNRNSLVQFLSSTQERNCRINLILFDIENFRTINRCFGASVANQLLVFLAGRIQALSEGTGYRISSDTFAVLDIRRRTEISVSEVTVQRWLSKLPASYDFGNKQIPCPLRVGFSSHDSGNADQAAALLDQAEIAVSEARNSLNRPVVQYSGSVKRAHQLRLLIGKHLPEALAGKEFLPAFQPQYELCNGQVVGFEALCRWTHSDLGSVSPELFIQIAEQMNLLQSLDLQLLAKTVNTLSQIQPLDGEISLSVNASPASVQDSGYVDSLVELSRLLPRWCVLEIELTENALITDDQSLKQSMLRLQKQGISMALDDFGSGYSNLGYLASFPFEKLKLDRCLISDLENSSRSADLVSGAIALAHRLGLKVVAEGIESEYQLDWLQAAGCDIGQGYLLSKPLPKTAGNHIFEPCNRLIKN